ncbi:UDP-N-acetylmuramate dehydrogenase [Orenia marismortui]|uniref:UDP-N-acetylenolpyruvoylglucosamine reductase n=1 Tax=Orenia marismortui TaxID=46469 RepID=A0A4R8HA04_9FIRM|nr:UDP-N-acetylmuramate dehydrogenase [Orenia marismortui]TDX53013.1 UDP-N-acetylmuramate dehydrogenase [Orenia marismortui]
MRIEYKEEISEFIKGQVLFNEPLKKYTSFKIGGPAEILVIPENYKELQKLLTYLYKNKLSYYCIGNGSNLLISDKGISNIVIRLPKKDSRIDFVGNRLISDASVSLPLLANKASKMGLSGLEFAAGLPATLGGAIVMNAGIGDLRSIGDLIVNLKSLLPTGEIKDYNRDELLFAYRKSRFQDSKEIIIQAELDLIPRDAEDIKAETLKLLKKRKTTQPLSHPNAGCIFKNPVNDSAGRLIDKAGCKGLRVGDAQVSTKHANFIINLGNATARNVLELIEQVKKIVFDKFGVNLIPEIIYLG